MPLKLGGVESVWHCLWVELDDVGLEVLCMEGNEGEEKGGEKELGFCVHVCFGFRGMFLGVDCRGYLKVFEENSKHGVQEKR